MTYAQLIAQGHGSCNALVIVKVSTPFIEFIGSETTNPFPTVTVSITVWLGPLSRNCIVEKTELKPTHHGRVWIQIEGKNRKYVKGSFVRFWCLGGCAVRPARSFKLNDLFQFWHGPSCFTRRFCSDCFGRHQNPRKNSATVLAILTPIISAVRIQFFN